MATEGEPTTRDSEEEIAIYTRAHARMRELLTVAMLAEWANRTPMDPAGDMTDDQCLAMGFCLFGNDLLQRSKWPPVTPQRCGWCIRASGDDANAVQSVEQMTHDEVIAHVQTCEHNPLVSEIKRLTKIVASVEEHLKSEIVRGRYPEILTGNDDESGELDSRPLTVAELVREMVTEIASRDQADLDQAEEAFTCSEVANELNIEDDSPEAIRAEITRLRAIQSEQIDRLVTADVTATLEQHIQTLGDELAEHFPIAICARAFMNDEASEADLRATSDVTLNATPEVRRKMLPERLRVIVGG